MSDLSRIFFLACEVRPSLPPKHLMGMLGKAVVQLITAGSNAGIGGVLQNCKDTKYDQVKTFYMEGGESGATPSEDEFRALIFHAIHKKIIEADLGPLDQAKLAGEIHQWSQGKNSATGEHELDWTADIPQPPFLNSGFFPFNRMCGDGGVPQEVITIISKPGAGKTTMALAGANSWKRLNLHDENVRTVEMLQSEIAPSALLFKVQNMWRDGDRELFLPGVDRLTFGFSAIIQRLKWLKENPDPYRMVLFDSVSGFCGQGTDPSSRDRYEMLYRSMMEIKNGCAFVLMFHHLKRGALEANLMEAAAGSSVIERFSGVMASVENKGIVSKMGKSYMDLKITTIKSRYGIPEPDNSFYLEYKTGDLIDGDEEFANEMLGEIATANTGKTERLRAVGLDVDDTESSDWS